MRYTCASETPHKIISPADMQAFALAERAKGNTLGFVPTMGALHAGHTSLMTLAREQCDILIVSIFVNPLQFAPGEDLDTYPHTPETDHAMCEEHGVDIVFRPSTMYPANHSSTVSVSGLSQGLCGASRPTHFDGVTTVVARLFGLVQPHIAVFGQKDFQQLAIIRRMVEDLAIPVEIIGGPIIREKDGIAMSSRNAYLSESERVRARSISTALTTIQAAVRSGEYDTNILLSMVQQILTVDVVDYISFVDPDTLTNVEHINQPTQLCIAAFLGTTRLIDNCTLSKEDSA